jgi:formylmethanofuran dehydrogenase subunit A
MKKLFICLYGFLITGCNPFFGYAPTSESIKARHWAENERKREPLVEVYCYPTLGENKCVTRVIPEKDHLLLGAYVTGEETCKKTWFERMHLEKPTGISNNRMRKELAYPDIPLDEKTKTIIENG